MKLLTKTNRLHLTFLLFLFPFMIVINYGFIQHFVHSEVNEILEHESERIKYYLASEQELPPSSYIVDISPAGDPHPALSQFRDTLVYDAFTQQNVPYRQYDFIASIDQEAYRISLRHIMLEAKELILWLLISTAFVLPLMALGLLLVNKRISKWTWDPFFQNLSVLRSYDITKKNKVVLEAAGISEFKSFNQVIETLIKRVKKDFQNLKEFNENISHEMQTPLTIIRNKMVLLLESQHLSEKELRWVQSAYQEANKLSRVGKSLTLISRIENQEFSRLESVNIRSTIDNIIQNMGELVQFKKLDLTVKLEEVKIMCDPILANILFTNLIKNAIQHNLEGGFIRMQLNEEKFEIENTGDILKLETEHLFQRFQKGNRTTDNLGLGLAINQRICELYGFQVKYEHEDGRHHFFLFFNR